MIVRESREEDEKEEHLHPAQTWRPFGAGLKRKRIDFVPASEADPSTVAREISAAKSSLSERYLSITLGEGAASDESRENPSSASGRGANTITVPPAESPCALTPPPPPPEILFCETCQMSINIPVTGLDPDSDPEEQQQKKRKKTALLQHESSIAHQAGLQHSHPPSHLDRNRHGLKYLASYGWDPDERRGLGASGDGIQAPLRAWVKNDTLGLGVKLADRRLEPKPVQRLDAKGVRKQEREERKKREKLHQMFYASADVEKYLGG